MIHEHCECNNIVPASSAEYYVQALMMLLGSSVSPHGLVTLSGPGLGSGEGY